MADLDTLGFHLVGYGCTTCIGNRGPLPEPVAKAIESGDLVVAAVLSGNRNFEGRVNPLMRANYLASPPLVVAYALAGTHRHRSRRREPLGTDTRRASRSTCATSGRRRRRCSDGARGRVGRRCFRERVRAASSRATSTGSGMPVPDGRPLRVGRDVDLHQVAAVLRRHDARRRRAVRTSAARACWRCSATRSPPTTSRPPARSRRTARPAAT